jgi:hypothetical protein
MGRPPQKIAAASPFSLSVFSISAFPLTASARYRAAPFFQHFSFSPYRPGPLTASARYRAAPSGCGATPMRRPAIRPFFLALHTRIVLQKHPVPYS